MRVRTRNARLQGDAKNPIHIHVGGTTEPVFSNCAFEHAHIYIEREWSRAPFYQCIFRDCKITNEDPTTYPFEGCILLGKDSEGRTTTTRTDGRGQEI
jgi:hypothetical protein